MALPLPPGTSLSWMPPSSLYCCHKSLSMISAAARNRRIATSPLVRPLLLVPLALAKAGTAVVNSPELMVVAAPTATLVRRKERRLVVRFARCASCSIERWSFLSACARCACCNLFDFDDRSLIVAELITWSTVHGFGAGLLHEQRMRKVLISVGYVSVEASR